MPNITKDYYHNIDLLANQLLNGRLHNITTVNRTTLGSTLTISDKGYMVYDTNLLTPFFWDGTQWNPAGGGTWGSITGTITAQTDLINYLSTNYYPLSSNPAGYLTSETDPIFTAWLSTPPNISIFNNDAGYLTSVSIPTLQQVLDNNHDLLNDNNFQGTGAGTNTGGSINAFGNTAGNGSNGSYNNFFGYQAGSGANGDGINAIGYQAGYNIVLGPGQILINAFGWQAGMNNSGTNLNAIGTNAAMNNSGSNVIAIGSSAALGNSLDNVIAIGEAAGVNNTYSHVILLGAQATADNDLQLVLSNSSTYKQARISYYTLSEDRKYELPDASGTLPLTVNGYSADVGGNITIPIGGSGTVTSIATSSPLTGGTITTAGTIGIDKATSSQDGYLSSTDWSTFDSKEPAISAGTTSQYWRGDKTWQTFPTIPTVGTWGALNYPTWLSGTPFVKMTAAGTFALDTNIYLTSITSSDVTTALGYTPVTDARTLTINGTTYDLTADRTWTIPTFTTPLTTKGDIYVRNGSGDTRLPVGLDTQVLIADSSTTTGLKWATNTAATPTGYYGAFQDNVTQTAAASNTGYAMIFRTVDISNGISVVTDGTNLTRITFANTGIYNLQFSSQFQNLANSPQDITIWLRKNGTDVSGSAGVIGLEARKNPGDPYHIVTGWNYVLSVVAGEYYEIIWSTTDHTNVSMNFYAAGSPPPSAASVIMTVTQQSGIMAGTGITAINSLTGAVQTLGTGTSGTDFAIVSSGTSHTFNLPTASASNRGALSSTDWTTFNNKVGATDTDYEYLMMMSFRNTYNY